jgi:hypothetical protein
MPLEKIFGLRRALVPAPPLASSLQIKGRALGNAEEGVSISPFGPASDVSQVIWADARKC